MSFRVSALVSAAVLMALGAVAPVSAQPVAPIRPRSSAFGNIFTPGLGQQQLQQQQFLNAFGGVGIGPGPVIVNPNFMGLGGLGLGGLPGFANPGQLAYQPALPGAFGTLGPVQKVAPTFNNYGHWYSRGGVGSYGHWYPNGVANGRGVLGYGGGGGGGGFGLGVGGAGALGTGTSRFGNSMTGNVGGTALGVGAMMNQFRR
jgi:hypothetical protein